MSKVVDGCGLPRHSQMSPGYHSPPHVPPPHLGTAGRHGGLPGHTAFGRENTTSASTQTLAGSGTRPTQTGERTAPGAPSLFSRFLFSVLEMIFKLTLLLKGGNLCFCLWEYFVKYHFSELSLLILTCTYPGSHFAMFMISNCHACSLIVNKNALKTRHA